MMRSKYLIDCVCIVFLVSYREQSNEVLNAFHPVVARRLFGQSDAFDATTAGLMQKCILEGNSTW